jgi:hypothetical protein
MGVVSTATITMLHSDTHSNCANILLEVDKTMVPAWRTSDKPNRVKRRSRCMDQENAVTRLGHEELQARSKPALAISPLHLQALSIAHLGLSDPTR